MKYLYRVTAHAGSRQFTYYVVATGMTVAEEVIFDLHRKKGWIRVKFVTVETVASESPYGEPSALILVAEDNGGAE